MPGGGESEIVEIVWKGLSMLITLCEDDSWRTRMYAVELFGRFADKSDSQAVAAVTKHLKDSDCDLRKAATEASKLFQ